mmetsp:Transcript_5200/g.13997  ORF Transcript_5200/g.13997 Transcript_5200/m.13997 type:complete len:482 (-) Transcript_5200:160-1605(-)|eukprot:CAMPEP_0198115038 /NCGR_PEP_ID=MMETSP1442-20131203/6247_1 /TAXON_ID= /ORGANISM="Craspedostauros australis, Strain CCMP3328" /LENGTH=481 /DNA_ID=CAMNT_0043772461 /DNA_START=131 /DNA_END=1576 /DNA_ORIENTATION=+
MSPNEKCETKTTILANMMNQLHMEAVAHDHLMVPMSRLQEQLMSHLSEHQDTWHIRDGYVRERGVSSSLTSEVTPSADSFLSSHFQRITIEDTNGITSVEDDVINSSKHLLVLNPSNVHVYQLSREEISTEELDPADGGGGGDDEWTAGCDSMPLPHNSLDGMWQNLVFEPSIKRSLLQYAISTLMFSQKGVSSNIISWNRILLLYGPPGTGKTSLCRALAQKLVIRLRHHFRGGAVLLDIRSHSLFSKWFSTSGKLVSSLFQLVRDMVEDDPTTLICVLIDEVESLAASRGNASGGDPSDAMRAVNSLLTSLDRLKSFPNVIVLATTNLTKTVDAAFIDRVDLKLRIGMPNLEARYNILHSCIHELKRTGILMDSNNGNGNGGNGSNGSTSATAHLDSFANAIKRETNDVHGSDITQRLLACATDAESLSGRSLRRLPLQTHALHMCDISSGASSSTFEFLQHLRTAVKMEKEAQRETLT